MSKPDLLLFKRTEWRRAIQRIPEGYLCPVINHLRSLGFTDEQIDREAAQPTVCCTDCGEVPDDDDGKWYMVAEEVWREAGMSEQKGENNMADTTTESPDPKPEPKPPTPPPTN
jgi:transcription elongation factor Elf1